MIPVDIRQVRMFVAVADTRSFTRAAERLAVAQPWLSVQIRRLEEQVGFALFLRSRNRAVELTREGEAFLGPARAYVEAGTAAAEAARAIRGSPTRRLTLGAPAFSADIPARVRLLDRFMAGHPGIDVEITNAWSTQLVQALAGHEIDMAFTVGPTDTEGCETLVLADLRWAVLVDKDVAAGWPARVPLSCLRGGKVAGFRRNINPVFYDCIEERLAREGIELVPLPESTLSGIFHHAQRSHVPVLIGACYVDTLDTGAGLVALPIADASFTHELRLVRRAGDDRPAVRAMWDTARRFVEELDSRSVSRAA